MQNVGRPFLCTCSEERLFRINSKYYFCGHVSCELKTVSTKKLAVSNNETRSFLKTNLLTPVNYNEIKLKTICTVLTTQQHKNNN